MNDLLEESITVLNKGKDITDFGKLLREAWQVKRSLSTEVSNSNVDGMYNQAISAGAIGGKLTGAGGGGFMLLFVPLEKQMEVRERLNGLIYVPFKFESAGSQIIFFSQQKDYSILEKERCKQQVRSFVEVEHSQ